MSKINRILLKISGESLMGDSNFGLNFSTTKFIAKEIKSIYEKNSNLSYNWWWKYF